MVGLGVVLDSTKGSNKPHVIVVNKADMIKPSDPSSPPPPPSPQPNHPNFSHWKSPSDHHQVTAAGGSFLDRCFLCQQKLLPGKDIFMYKGDRAFCSKECRCRQIFIDDNYFPLAPMKQPPTSSSSSSSPSSPSRKRTKNRANGFAY
ncbi:FCS-Like Zinc finger 15-like [Rhododendron vialii]|uniref:FCS-Like Zinc finger 15-like n=1 Tax=Rhododendron vialii TaxID=182163 RepID=UPI00265E8D66|nr:FCS-Like Zinc finger 15-like [Rhododendron vialii]